MLRLKYMSPMTFIQTKSRKVRDAYNRRIDFLNMLYFSYAIFEAIRQDNQRCPQSESRHKCKIAPKGRFYR